MKLLVLLGLMFVFSAKAADLATWYGPEHQGKRMANLRRFDYRRLTCASWHYPLGTKLLVTSEQGLSVTVEVTDRGPNKRLMRKDGRSIDLSLTAFERLAGKELGLLPVTITRLAKEK